MSADVRAKWEQMEQFPAIATFFSTLLSNLYVPILADLEIHI